MEKKEYFRRVLTLFTTFFKIGAFTFGGGYAMIPLIQHETVEKHGWVSDENILDIIAVAESTPGPIAINSATFVGYQTAGVPGSAAATLGVVLPSFIIILVISHFLRQFMDITAVRYAFTGIRAGVLALIVKALWGMVKKCPKSAVAYVLMCLAFALVILFDVHVLIIIAASALVGLAATLIAKRGDKEEVGK